MLHSDLLDSSSHVNIQEWRETARGKDGWGAISREARAEKRYFHGNGKGEQGDGEAGEAVIIVEDESGEGTEQCLWAIH